MVIHETGAIRRAKGSSNRSFGFVFFAVLVVLGLSPLRKGGAANFAFVFSGILFLLFAILYPAALGPLNRAWTKLGYFLHAVMNPLIMGFLFFFLLSPLALLLRILRRKVLSVEIDRAAKTYWEERADTRKEFMRDPF